MPLLNAPCPHYEEAFAEVATGFTRLITGVDTQPLPQQHWMKLYQHVFKICSNSHEPRPHVTSRRRDCHSAAPPLFL